MLIYHFVKYAAKCGIIIYDRIKEIMALILP